MVYNRLSTKVVILLRIVKLIDVRQKSITIIDLMETELRCNNMT